jgi:hypothetical protein
MKILFAFITLLVVLVGCTKSPKPEELEQLVEGQVKEQIVEMVTQTQEALPAATVAPAPEPPTLIYEAKVRLEGIEDNYIVELGYCPSTVNISGNPKENSNCVVTLMQTEYFEDGEEKEVINDKIQDSPLHLHYKVFCTLYQVDGTYINTNINNDDGKLYCRP